MKSAHLPKKTKRLVIKIGSSLLTKNGRINAGEIRRYATLIEALHREHYQVALVTSGAVASAGIATPSKSLPFRQALASVGQVRLMEIYRKIFEKKNIPVGQVLLSEYLLKHRPSYLNARFTLGTLFELKVLPIINENDVVSTEELKFGDNDTLGAIVAGLIEADLYVILSDVDGLFRNFGTPAQTLIERVEVIDASISREAGGSGSEVGTGGMASKVRAAKLAHRFGIPTLVTNGRVGDLRGAILKKNRGSLFVPPAGSENRINRKKTWIASGLHLPGKIHIDNGAEDALLKKSSSLLASGILRVEGNFHSGDVCAVYGKRGREIARGISNFSSYEVRKIMGRHSREIPILLGESSYEEVIHRDNLVRIEAGQADPFSTFPTGSSS